MFILGRRSRRELVGVHPDLVKVVKAALKISEVDFTVHDGIRTKEEQRILVDNGASKTMWSRHIEGCAVDLVPILNGKIRWEWKPIYKIALAVSKVSAELEVPIRWGAIWDCSRMNELPRTVTGIEDAVGDYIDRRMQKGKKAFLDGPHYELPREFYPKPYIP